MIEALNALRVCIPNINRPAGVLINQNQPMNIEEKDGYYSVTMYVRAVDFASKYLFLGPFYLTASMDNGNWVVSEPRFDPGIDGCYYDVVGTNGSHLKIYEHMAVIDENPVYFEDCEGVSLRDCDGENDGVVRFDLKNASFKVFHWNTTTQNPVFMTKVLSICDLMIRNAQQESAADSQKEAELSAQEEAARIARESLMRPASTASSETAAPPERSPFDSPFEAPAKSPFAPRPAAAAAARPAATARPAAARPGSVTEAEAPAAPERPRFIRQSVTPERPAAPKVEKPADNSQHTAERRISLKTGNSGGIRNADRIGIHNPEVDAKKASREATPDDFDSWNPEPAKSPFVPLKNPTPDMMPPKPEPGPAITHVSVGKWGSREEDLARAKANESDGQIRPMTAQSLSHLDDWKPYSKSVVSSPEEEVAKYKRLLDIGAISQDEFEIKKKQLLGFD